MIYLDNAATTPLDNDVLEGMMPYFTQHFGNSLSQHDLGRTTANAVVWARDTIARIIGCLAEEVYFTSSGTEADNWAIKGYALANMDRGKHLIVSAIEHPAVLSSCKDLQKLGFEVTFVYPDERGIVSAQSIEEAIRQDTILVAVMHANNEVGTIQPIEEISSVCKNKGIFFFVDCVQTAGVLVLPTQYVDALSISAHKFYGPKGVGCLYIRKGTRIERLISGGHQERAMRGGTVNTPNVVGMALALKKAFDNRLQTSGYIRSLKDAFVGRVLSKIEGVNINGGGNILPGHANLSIAGCDGERVLFMLDIKGIALSTGSACSSGAVTPSHVLLAMGIDEKTAKSSIRFSFGKYNTLDEVENVIDVLSEAVNKIRSMRK